MNGKKGGHITTLLRSFVRRLIRRENSGADERSLRAVRKGLRFRSALWTMAALAALLAIARASYGIQARDVRDQFHRILGILTTSTAPMPAQAEGDLLQFLDGSSMHGDLRGMDIGRGLQWMHRDARSPIDLRPVHVDFIRFVHSISMTLSPTCHIRFSNGDDLFGSLSSLDTESLEFSTWFGGMMKIPRSAIETITFLSKNYSIVYEGPTDAGGWVIGNNGPQSWAYRDGSFITQSAGILGRDFNLSGSCTIEFDLAWGGYFNLVADIYSDMLDHFETENSSYMLDFSHEQVVLQRARGNSPPVNLGNAALPNLDGRNKMHVTIHCNKQESTVAVLVDNTLVKRWKDNSGFGGTGTGILFENRAGTASVKLSNFRVSRWEGRFEPQEIANPSTNSDSVCFLNHDKALGKIAAIKDGKVDLVLEGNLLHVPIERVTQIDFALPTTNAEPRGPWQVRAMFPGGGSVSFELKTWDDKQVSGQSAVFGALNFKPSAIRELEFNLDSPRVSPAENPEAEYEELDE
jgi:hypothetical protein